MRLPTLPAHTGSTALSQGSTTTLSSGSAEAPPKLNALPHEAEVVVTGARPGRSSENRELFTETTTTVVVFENGAVIRLGAAVKPGQLLFVTHAKSKHEVIAQVTRKRDSRPSSCYVELEFSEPFPNFWGVKFPKVAEKASVTPAQKVAAEMVQDSEVTEDEPQAPAAAPSNDEMLALKNEVEALRNKLKQVETQAAPAMAASASKAAAPQVAVKSGSSKENPVDESGERAGRTNSATELSAEEEALLPKLALNFGPAPAASAVAKPRAAVAPKAVFVPRRSKMPVILSIAAMLIAGIGMAYFKHWIPGIALGKRSANDAAATPAHNFMRPPNASAGVAGTNTAPTSANASTAVSHSTSSEAAASKPENSGAQNQIVAAVVSSAPVTQHAVARENVAPIDTERNSPTQPSNAAKPAEMTRVSKRAIIRAPVESNSVAVSDAGNAAGFSAPKLVKALRPNSPAEALQGFISGNVLLDALVDPAGRVKSSKIISGPEKLRRAALEAIQQYKYEPAMQNGKPVPAHVKVTIQFWYEP